MVKFGDLIEFAAEAKPPEGLVCILHYWSSDNTRDTNRGSYCSFSWLVSYWCRKIALLWNKMHITNDEKCATMPHIMAPNGRSLPTMMSLITEPWSSECQVLGPGSEGAHVCSWLESHHNWRCSPRVRLSADCPLHRWTTARTLGTSLRPLISFLTKYFRFRIPQSYYLHSQECKYTILEDAGLSLNYVWPKMIHTEPHIDQQLSQTVANQNQNETIMKTCTKTGREGNIFLLINIENMHQLSVFQKIYWNWW